MAKKESVKDTKKVNDADKTPRVKITRRSGGSKVVGKDKGKENGAS